jgi:hypothetical protein
MDAINLKSIEALLEPMPVDDVKARIGSVGGRFFSVDFARKTDKKVNGKVVEAAGSIRRMLCRRGVAKYVKGVQDEGQRVREDERNDVLTVWDIGVYQELRRAGKEQEEAGSGAYRRINLVDVKAISIEPMPVEIEQVRDKRVVEVPENV